MNPFVSYRQMFDFSKAKFHVVKAGLLPRFTAGSARVCSIASLAGSWKFSTQLANTPELLSMPHF
jgi:hypothetical protein